MIVYLEGLQGEYAGRRIPLTKGSLSLGRSSSNNMRFGSANISRDHAVISYENGDYILRDLESKHGTFVNDQRVKQVALRNGDVICLGESTFTFVQPVTQRQEPSGYIPREDNASSRPISGKKHSKAPMILLVILLITVVGMGAFLFARHLFEQKAERSVGFDESAGQTDQISPAYSDSTETVDPSFGAIDDPYPESLPISPVAAGMPIYYDGWSMMVSSAIDTDSSERWGIEVVIQNLGKSKRIFRFTNAGVTAKDNLGNIYPPANLYAYEDCEAYYHVTKNLEVDSQEMIKIKGFVLGYDHCDRSSGLHSFMGPISLDADQLILHFEDFGPFDGVDYVIDL